MRYAASQPHTCTLPNSFSCFYQVRLMPFIGHLKLPTFIFSTAMLLILSLRPSMA